MELNPLSLKHYVGTGDASPVLSLETEQDLCCRWQDHHDVSAAHQLAGSHLHLVIKTARAYRGYGLPQEDLIGEGHVGLMRAVCRFDSSGDVRFATYAIRWIHATILEYIMHNILGCDRAMPGSEDGSQIAKTIGVSARKVGSMSWRTVAADPFHVSPDRIPRIEMWGMTKLKRSHHVQAA